MEIRLAYGNAGITLHVPEWVRLDRFGLTSTSRPVTQEKLKREFAAGGGRRLGDCSAPLIVVNDGYRNTPTADLLAFLDSFDRSVLDRAAFLVATGTHDAPTDEHLHRIFGPLLERVRERVNWHDARDDSAMIPVGSDRFGETVYLNRAVAEHDLVFVIGSVEPHYFAGFTGGRKSLFPGLTDLATIERNHNLAGSLQAAPLRLDGNPVAEHLHELLALVDRDKLLSAQIVMDADGQMIDVCVGPLDDAFSRAVVSATSLYAHPVDQPYDVVLAELRSPLDRNLYQAQKALENTQMGVVDGGSAVVLSACEEGIGSQFFFDLAATWDRENNCPRDGVARFGSHKLSRVNALSRRINVHLYSELPDDTARRVFYQPVADLQEFLQERLTPDTPRLAIVHDAGHAVLQSRCVS